MVASVPPRRASAGVKGVGVRAKFKINSNIPQDLQGGWLIDKVGASWQAEVHILIA
jgi:hypothetical protein